MSSPLAGPPLVLIRGDAQNIPIQAYLRPGGNVPAQFQAGDTLAAQVLRPGSNVPVFEPACGWFTAPDFTTGDPTQTGYDQGQVEVTMTNGQTALLWVGAQYRLVVRWTPAAEPDQSSTIIRILICCEAPGIP